MRRRTESKRAGEPQAVSLHTDPPLKPSTAVSQPSSVLSVVNAFWQGDYVVTLTRGSAGGLRQIKFPAEYVCYLRDADLTNDLRTRLRSLRYIKSMSREGDWWRLRWHDWKLLKKACGPDGFFERLKIPTYEADLNPVRRWLTDTPNVEIAKPTRCFLDLEVDSRHTIQQMLAGEARVLCWALVRPDGTKIAGVLEADTDEAEVELLKDFWFELMDYEQVCSWSDFDYEVLKERSWRLDINVPLKRWLWVDHLAIFRRMNMSASESGDEKQSMSLENVAQAILGEGKGDVAANRSYEYWAAGGAERRKLVDYMVRDADLERRIEEATGYLDLHQAVCEVCTTLPNTSGGNPTNFVEGYLLRLGKANGVHFKTKFHHDKTKVEQFEGAYVMEPTQLGLLKGVHVCDFAALYPSIIITFNLSPETYNVQLSSDPTDQPLPRGYCRAPGTGAVFSTERRGMLPQALDALIRLRGEWKERKNAEPPGTPAWKDADRRSSAYKIAANSFYGVMGSAFSRFYERAIAESTTLGGQWLLKETIRAAEARRWAGIYGDTDSIFIGDTTREAFATFVKWCNADLYPRLLDEQGVPPQWRRIKLSYEKEFARLVLCGKKRYAGRYAHYEGKDASADSKPEIKGLEFKRGDTLRLARQLQLEVINALLFDECEDPDWYVAKVEAWKHRVLADQLALDDITMSKRMTKDPKEYSRRKKKDGSMSQAPAHVELAARLIKKGLDIRPGDRVPYIVVDGASPMKVVHPSEFDGAFDRYYIWEQLVFPPTQRVLEAAFGATTWKQHLKVRPKKPRVKRSAV